MYGQISLFDFIDSKTYPEWHLYVRTSDGNRVSAYKCNDKDWYVIKSLQYDHYWMEQQKEFENSYHLIN